MLSLVVVPIYIPSVVYGLRLFIVVVQELHCLSKCLHVCMIREGFSPLGETGPPKGEEAALPTTLSGLGSVDGSCPCSLLDLRGWGSSGGGALRKPSLCKQQSLNAKIKIIRGEMLRSRVRVCYHFTKFCRSTPAGF